MSNISNLVRQHAIICERMNTIRSLTSVSNISRNAGEILRNINLLAEKLNVHIKTEDQILYPNLLVSSNVEISKFAKEYINSNDSIYDDYEKYRKKFNSRRKICSNIESFKKDTEIIIKSLEGRLAKENLEIFPMI